MSHTTNQIEVTADGQDITITIGDYTDADARLAISVTDAGGDGSLAYNNTTGVITYTGPSASEVRAHFSAGTNITITNGQISSTDTNTTYDLSAVDGADSKKIIRLTGSDETDSDVVLVPGTNITLSRTDNEITINSTPGNIDRLIAGEAELILNDDSTVSFPNNVIDGGANTIDLKSGIYAELWYHNRNTPEAGDGTDTYIWAEENYAGIAVGSVDYGFKEWYFKANGTTRFPTLTVPVNDAGYSNVTGQVLKFDTSDAGQAIIFGPSATSGAAERIAIQGAPGADGTYGEGGDVYLWAGRGGSEVDGTGGGNGGDIKIRGGQGRGTGGSYGGYVRIQGGDSEYGTGGYVDIQGGDGTTNGYTRILTSTGTERIKVDDSGLRLNNAYTMPDGAGSLNQVLTTDGEGGVTWSNVPNPFDQDLNTTDDPTFSDVYLTNTVYTPKVDAAINGNLILQGDELQFKTVDVTAAANTLNFNSLGYRAKALTSSSTLGAYISATSTGTTSATFNFYYLTGLYDAGSDTMLGASTIAGQPKLFGVVIGNDNGEVVDASTVTDLVDLPLLDYDTGYFEFGVKVSSITDITGTYDPDITLNTQTCTINLVVGDEATTANALLTDTDVVYADCFHYARNTDATLVAKLTKLLDGSWYSSNTLYRAPSLSNYFDGDKIAATYVSYSYTGTQDWQITPRRVINLGTQNRINEHIRVPFGLGVGPGSIQTNRGMARDGFDSLGININNNGKLIGYTGKTGLNLTQFKNNSNFSSGLPAERCGPNFTFNSFAGNEDTANNQLYLTSGDGIGQITWFAQPATTGLTSSTYVPASITVKATETHDTSIKQGAGMYLQYTPNSQGGNSRPRTFLRAEDATVEMLAKTTIKLGKFNNSSATANRNLSTAAAATWVTVDDTSAAFTVPVQFPVYTKAAANAITGSVGMQICISDSNGGGGNVGGMMAFWDTTNSRWSYIHDNNAL
jgi:hypothetical protein